MKSTELFPILDALAQPVFVVQDGVISYTNPALDNLAHVRGTSVYTLLGVHMAEYRDFSGEGALSLPIIISYQMFRANVQRADPGDIFLLEPTADAASSETEQRLTVFGEVAQEIRRPMSSLFAVASMMFRALEEYESPKLRRQAAIMNRNFYQLLRTLGNLSDAKAFLSGRIQPRMDAVDLAAYVGAFTDRVAPLCEASGIHFIAELPARECSCMINPRTFKRALLNLISNALKYTPQGGTIRLTLELSQTTGFIRITDSGEGMDAAALASVFDRYEHPADLDPHKGLGLGLPLVRAIAAMHGGTVMLNSTPGVGTTAVFSFALRHDTSMTFRSPVIIHTGLDRMLVELSDVLPDEVFDSENVN